MVDIANVLTLGVEARLERKQMRHSRTGYRFTA